MKNFHFSGNSTPMKKSIILISALSMLGLMLVSCSSSTPETTTTTTRQATVTAPPPEPPLAQDHNDADASGRNITDLPIKGSYKFKNGGY